MGALELDLSDFQALRERVVDLYQEADVELLLERFGDELVRQSKQRIDAQKATAEGVQWPARRQPAPHPLLEQSRRLIESITFAVGTGEVEVGSNLVYAATHLFGDTDRQIPARQYLGISDSNATELERLAAAVLEEALA